MKYFVLNGKKQEKAPENFNFEETLKEHQAYMKAFFENGTILFGGPKKAGCGAMVVKAESEEWVRNFLDQDPIVKAGAEDYDIIEFSMYNCQEEIRGWFE